jgi:uncharacterized protein (DUF1697 family)
MAVLISMLRGVNVGGHNKISMADLRTMYESLGLLDPQTFVQSGNLVFRAKEQNLPALAKRIEDAIEKHFGFRCDVIVRTPAELKDVIARNPFGKRRNVDPGKLLVTFLANDPSAEARDQVLKIKTDPEELHINGREVYIYFPNGIGQSKLSWPTIGKKLGTTGTGRNWNSVTKLLEMAERLEAET